MFTKLIVVCALAAAACGLEYPPGVDPAACPDYPYCRERLVQLVRLAPEPAPLPLPVPEWVHNPSILPVAPVDPAHMIEVTPPAPVDLLRYPADFDAAFCPNYPYCF